MTAPHAKPTPPPSQRRRHLPGPRDEDWGAYEDGDLLIPLPLQLDDERQGFEILVWVWLLDDNTVTIDKITVADNRPVQGRDRASRKDWDRVMRRLPLASYLADAVDLLPDTAFWDDPQTEADPGAEAARKIGDKIELAARIYLDHDGYDPVKAVARQQGIAYNTARSRIRLARERGLIPTGDPHRGRRTGQASPPRPGDQ